MINYYDNDKIRRCSFSFLAAALCTIIGLT